jgi:hypothetical protein
MILKNAHTTIFFWLHRDGMDTVIGIEGCVERLETRMARSSKCGGSISFSRSFS